MEEGMKRFVVATVYLVALVVVTTAQPTQKPVDGKQVFRFDTFGDEQLWTDTLQLHQAIATVPPATALSVGLKVDVEALPVDLVALLEADQVDLTDPSVTIELLRLNAV